MLSLSFSAFQAWSFSFLVGVRFFCLAAIIRRNASITSLSATLTLCLSSCLRISSFANLWGKSKSKVYVKSWSGIILHGKCIYCWPVLTGAAPVCGLCCEHSGLSALLVASAALPGPHPQSLLLVQGAPLSPAAPGLPAPLWSVPLGNVYEEHWRRKTNKEDTIQHINKKKNSGSLQCQYNSDDCYGRTIATSHNQYCFICVVYVKITTIIYYISSRWKI